VTTGAALGSAAMYGRLHEFPVEFRPASYAHDPVVLSRLRSLVSVNSAIEVDLLGQVGAEVRGGTHIGAVGGQVDSSRAAALTGARSVIALRSESGGRHPHGSWSPGPPISVTEREESGHGRRILISPARPGAITSAYGVQQSFTGQAWRDRAVR
jgi:hypothetical protein